MAIPVILTLESGILSVMLNHKMDTIQQSEIFDVQYQQLIQRSTIIGCNDAVLTLSNNHTLYEIYHDRNRIVKSPGYEILLENVEELHFDEQCKIHYESK